MKPGDSGATYRLVFCEIQGFRLKVGRVPQVWLVFENSCLRVVEVHLPKLNHEVSRLTKASLFMVLQESKVFVVTNESEVVNLILKQRPLNEG